MTHIDLPFHEMLHDGVVSHRLHQVQPSPHLFHPLTNGHSQDVLPVSTNKPSGFLKHPTDLDGQ